MTRLFFEVFTLCFVTLPLVFLKKSSALSNACDGLRYRQCYTTPMSYTCDV